MELTIEIGSVKRQMFEKISQALEDEKWSFVDVSYQGSRYYGSLYVRMIAADDIKTLSIEAIELVTSVIKENMFEEEP